MSRRAAWAALAAVTLLRLAVATVAPLSADEAYYWVWSRALAWGYPDHPPMVALWVRAGTLAAGQTALGVRLLGPLAAALGSVLLADAGERLWPGRRAGLWAAALLNATLAFGIGAAAMTPDTPLLFFWTAALWALARFATGGPGSWLGLAGLLAGLALDSKYTALFLPAGALLWLLAVPALRPALRTVWPWAAAAFCLACFAPVLAWNAAHGWASLLRQGGRAADWRPARAVQFLGELVGGQIGLATPLIAVLFAAGLAAATRAAWQRRDPGSTLLAAVTLPAAAVFLQHALGDRVQGNWPAILYPGAALAAAGLAATRWQRLRAPAAALGLALTLAAYWHLAVAPLPFAPRSDPATLRLAGWSGLAGEAAELMRRDDARFLAADDYAAAAALAFYAPPGVAVLGLDPRWALFALPEAQVGGETGLLLRSARRDAAVETAPWAAILPAGRLVRGRDGHAVEAYRVYRVTGGPPRPGLALLPRPD